MYFDNMAINGILIVTDILIEKDMSWCYICQYLALNSWKQSQSMNKKKYNFKCIPKIAGDWKVYIFEHTKKERAYNGRTKETQNSDNVDLSRWIYLYNKSAWIYSPQIN